MSGDNIPNNDFSKDSSFIRQTIVRQKKSLRHRVKRGITFIIAGLLFGGSACVTFVFLKPVFEAYIAAPEVEPPPIVLPEDEIPVSTDTPMITETATEATEAIESVVQSLIQENELDINDYGDLFKSLSTVANEANKSIVSIHAVKQGTDWFDNTFNQSGIFPGVILAKTSSEILLMTTMEGVEEADSLEVWFGGDELFQAQIKEQDQVTRLVILSVSTEGMEAGLLDALTIMTLGNSHTIKQGDPLIALGNPSGSVHSTVYGTAAYIRRGVQMTDGLVRIFETDCLTKSGSISFLVNLSGELVGVKNNSFLEDANSPFTAAMAISDLKPLIEKMMNGQDSAFLGVKGQDITEAMAEESGVPKGIYIETVELNSSAYHAGIQSGDIIVSIGGDDIVTMKELQNKLASVEPGTALKVVAMRGGREEYKEIGFDVTLDGR